MLIKFKADLHIHTCLSPCADIDISPSAIVKAACEKEIDIIAVTDHNSAENVGAVQRAAKGKGLTVLAGMEVSTSEEVHILAIFEETESVMKLQEIVYDNLMPGLNSPDLFGEQVVADEYDNVLGFNKLILISVAKITAKFLVETVHTLGGIAIASHIDRETFGIIGHLGFIPDDLRLDALELSPRISKEKALQVYNDYGSFAWVSSSDAHRIVDIGERTTTFSIGAPTLKEISYALKNIDGRKASWG